MSIRKPPSEPNPPLRSTQANTPALLEVDANQSNRKPPRIPFQNLQSAQSLLNRVIQRLSPSLAVSLPSLLAESPDPDSALMQFDRLLSDSPEAIPLFNQHNALAHYAIVVFGHSRFLGETLLRNTDILPAFLRERNLDLSLSREEFHQALARFRTRSFETDVSLLLARFKRREYIRIMLRDVLKIAPLAETTAEISALADVLIKNALREADTRLSRRFDSPQHLEKDRLVHTPFAVLSLGKLGGSELNYSSDVDLMFIFGDGEAPPGANISNREYFIRLAQQVTEILSRVTDEGPVFRIDLRLRPSGGEGELAISLSHALRYYETQAHDWERQALIKARYSGGDLVLGRKFIRAVEPHIYTEKMNFAAIKTALVAREKMHARRHQLPALETLGQSTNVKIDRGGIRDIEFLVQCLQRVYGGKEPWLRSGGTLFSLQKLHDKGHVSGKEFHDLSSAYEFLRHLEHRLQLRHGQQTHRLPSGKSDLRILQRSMEGYAPGEYRIADLIAVVKQRMEAVSEIYRRIIYQQQSRSQQEVPDAPFELHGTLDPDSDLSSQQILQQLAADSPELHRTVTNPDLSLPARANLFRFLWSSFATSERYSVLRRNPEAAARAIVLFESSDYLTDILVRHPEEIASLANTDRRDEPSHVGTGYLFESSLGPARSNRDPVFAYVGDSPAPHHEKLSLLRQHYRHRVFTASARDITDPRDVYSSLASTTAAAEDAMAAAFSLAGSPQGLTVMALGRLGSSEFDLLSDADVLFVGDENRDRESLTKSAEQMMQVLAAYTRDGMAFPVDARLRPHGGEGELVVTPAQLQMYFQHEAQPWEALMYTKLRYLAGSRRVAEKSIAATQTLFQRFAADSRLSAAIREMRRKLDTIDFPEHSFKTSPGAIYDTDFITAFLLLKNDVHDKTGTLRDRLWRCVATGGVDKADAAVLDHAAELLRTVEHVVRLVVGRPRKWLPATEHASRVTEKLVSDILRRDFPQGLETALLQSCETTRKIFTRIF